MYEIVKKFCEDKQANNGLFLLDMPTGFGKTYNIVKYIYDACQKPENENRKFFFVTTLLKNLPVEDLYTWFKNAGQEELFKKKFLRIESNADCVLERLIPLEKRIPEVIRSSQEYKSLMLNIKAVKNLEKNRDAQTVCAALNKDIREREEPAFRRFLQFQLAPLGSMSQKLSAVKNDKKWQWLPELYPAVLTCEKQILFMSMDKFLGRNSPIIESSYMFYNNDKIIKDAFVFIDEFDATKETILKNIIENGLRDQVDFIDLFLAIYSALQVKEFPQILFSPSKQREKGKYKSQSLEGLISEIKEEADEIYKKFSLNFSHRTKGDAESGQNFLFQDHQYHAILDGNKNFVSVESNPKDKINDICFSSEKPKKEIQNVHHLLGSLRYFVKHFQTDVYILAQNFLQNKNEIHKPGEDDYTLEFAIRSVLELFHLSKDFIDYLTAQILISGHKIQGNIQPGDMDLSFYNNGFRYYAFENSPSNDMQSRMMMLAFQNTPEKQLLRFCEKAKVIGISATATLPTVVGNFDIGYLHEKMQHLFPEVSPEDKKRLQSDFENAQKGYSEIDIDVELFGKNIYGVYDCNSWKNVFDNSEKAQYVFELLERELPDSSKNYCKERYLRIALAYQRFWQNEDIQSFLCVLMKHPERNDRELDRNILLEIFDLIHLKSSDCVRWLNGYNFEEEKKKIQDELTRKTKLFVISVYATLGAGQNLQYNIPKNSKKLVRTNDYKANLQKDFDAIYLDKPTNVLVNLSGNISQNDFIKYLYQVEFLQENIELSMKDALGCVRRAFSTYSFKKPANFKDPIYDTKSYRCYVTRMIIQAIGRICRTNMKHKKIHIYADSQIADVIDYGVIEGRLLNKEFLKLVEECRKIGKPKDWEIQYIDKADLKSVRVNKDILNLLSGGWNPYKIGKWRELRNLALQHPTMSKSDVESNFIASNYYVQLPKKGNFLYYKQEGDYNNVHVSFDSQKDFICESAEKTRLDKMLAIEGVREFFIENHYATDFEPNDYIMCPTMWNNIYKGALGEAVGKYLFKKLFGVELEEIEDREIFELFDYKVKDKPIYVDFKDWSESTNSDRSKMADVIVKKSKKCNCQCAIIVNIVAQNSSLCGSMSAYGVKMLAIDALYVGGELNENAWKLIHETLGMYNDQNQ